MAIYVDALVTHAPDSYRGPGDAQAARVGARYGHRWCHLLAHEADCAELHEFAAALGMKREWFRGDHYDLVPPKRLRAVLLGALEIGRRRVVELLRAHREARRS